MNTERTADELLREKIYKWTSETLDQYPGWTEWHRKRLNRTLFYEEEKINQDSEIGDFEFNETVSKQHDVVIQYLGLHHTILLLKDCEFYFRRYPFRGLPVTRSAHLNNICEMYFNRFYEFRERLKKIFKALIDLPVGSKPDAGKFIRTFDQVFDAEIRERNQIHHHRRFDDVALDKVLLTELFKNNSEMKADWEKEHLFVYRKAAREWSQRVKRRSRSLEAFLNALAEYIARECTFLDAEVAETRAHG